MLLIPAIDIKDGQCVRLKRGEKSLVTVFSSDPFAVAESWAAQGCQRLHLVDLDGAFDGAPTNHALIRRICGQLEGTAVQVGGGIRSRSTLEALLEAGASQVVLGTQAIEDRQFLLDACQAAPGKCFLGLDTRGDRVAVRGWTRTLDLLVDDLVREVRDLALAGFIHTDISRDGMMMGIGEGLDVSIRLAEISLLPVVVSGGVTDLHDLGRIRQAASNCRGEILGVVSGRALYENSFSFAQGQAALNPQNSSPA